MFCNFVKYLYLIFYKDFNMRKRNYLLLLLCAMSFTTFASEYFEKNEKLSSSPMERAVLPSEMTSANFTSRLNQSTDASLRGTPPGLPPEPGKGPIGGGLLTLTLCAGIYLFNSKKNRK